jgi:NADPH:quinone reductase-like Zn-dependent oxidoreductase
MKPRKAEIYKFSHKNSFKIVPVELPELSPGQVKVKVHYAGINFADVLARRGYYKWAKKLPLVPGFECSGVISEVTEGSSFRLGEPVMAAVRFGGYSEEIIAEEQRVFRMPESLDFKEACSVPAVYLTAYQAVHSVMRIREGDDLLINAAAGGLGLAVIQLALAAGAKPTGLVSSLEKKEFLNEIYNIPAFTYDEFQAIGANSAAGQQYKFLLDSFGGSQMKSWMSFLKESGLCVTLGGANFVPPTSLSVSAWIGWLRKGWELLTSRHIDSFELIEKNRGIAGVQLLLLWDQIEHLRTMMTQILDLVESNKLKPYPGEIFDFENVYQAHQFMESRRSKGKLLLKTQYA